MEKYFWFAGLGVGEKGRRKEQQEVPQILVTLPSSSNSGASGFSHQTESLTTTPARQEGAHWCASIFGPNTRQMLSWCVCTLPMLAQIQQHQLLSEFFCSKHRKWIHIFSLHKQNPLLATLLRAGWLFSIWIHVFVFLSLALMGMFCIVLSVTTHTNECQLTMPEVQLPSLQYLPSRYNVCK